MFSQVSVCSRGRGIFHNAIGQGMCPSMQLGRGVCNKGLYAGSVCTMGVCGQRVCGVCSSCAGAVYGGVHRLDKRHTPRPEAGSGFH